MVTLFKTDFCVIYFQNIFFSWLIEKYKEYNFLWAPALSSLSNKVTIKSNVLTEIYILKIRNCILLQSTNSSHWQN